MSHREKKTKREERKASTVTIPIGGANSYEN
jgi:hypothetical protein